MKLNKPLLTILLLCLICIPSGVLAQLYPPSIPLLVYGDVTINNESAPVGTIISVENNDLCNLEIASAVISEVGKYFIEIPAKNASQLLTYKVNGAEAAREECVNPMDIPSVKISLEVIIGDTINKDETEKIEGKDIVVTPDNSTAINMGNSLTVEISSDTNTSALIKKIEKLVSGNVAVLAGNNLLNAYEIKITGANLTITVTMSYDDTDIDESTIAPYRHDGTSWVPITSPSPIIDTVNNKVIFTIKAGDTPYGVFGKTAAPPASGGSSGGGGGLLLGLHAPTPPAGGFILKINNGASETTSRQVTLTLNGGAEARMMAISNSPDFQYASQELYTTSKSWVLSEGEGLKTIYAKFYNGGGRATEPISSSITLKSQASSALIIKQRVDANNDNKIDILDFNTLIVNWASQTPNNIADFNNDNKVDILDFNLLMVHWSK